ncbi:galectin-7-like isoform X2 [Ctenocephalides felis]|nr:galectin-7-like isoform X2 [Ctenocephalides felis]
MSPPNNHFVGHVPRPLRHGDVVVIKGMVADEPEKFSINLCCDHHFPPREVAYHSKTIFPASEGDPDESHIVTNQKVGNEWQQQSEPHSNPFRPGAEFTISIHLEEDGIVTYEGHSNFVHECLHSHDVGDIKSVQVWHDVRHVRELTFRFAE